MFRIGIATRYILLSLSHFLQYCHIHRIKRNRDSDTITHTHLDWIGWDGTIIAWEREHFWHSWNRQNNWCWWINSEYAKNEKCGSLCCHFGCLIQLGGCENSTNTTVEWMIFVPKPISFVYHFVVSHSVWNDQFYTYTNTQIASIMCENAKNPTIPTQHCVFCGVDIRSFNLYGFFFFFHFVPVILFRSFVDTFHITIMSTFSS